MPEHTPTMDPSKLLAKGKDEGQTVVEGRDNETQNAAEQQKQGQTHNHSDDHRDPGYVEVVHSDDDGYASSFVGSSNNNSLQMNHTHHRHHQDYLDIPHTTNNFETQPSELDLGTGVVQTRNGRERLCEKINSTILLTFPDKGYEETFLNYYLLKNNKKMTGVTVLCTLLAVVTITIAVVFEWQARSHIAMHNDDTVIPYSTPGAEEIGRRIGL